jgi:hypothetical protein
MQPVCMLEITTLLISLHGLQRTFGAGAQNHAKPVVNFDENQIIYPRGGSKTICDLHA